MQMLPEQSTGSQQAVSAAYQSFHCGIFNESHSCYQLLNANPPEILGFNISPTLAVVVTIEQCIAAVTKALGT